LLPPVSFDYSLLQLYPSIAVLALVALQDSDTKRPALWVALALVLTPTNFFYHHGLSAQGQIKCGLLIVLLYQSLAYPIHSRLLLASGSSRNAQSDSPLQCSNARLHQV